MNTVKEYNVCLRCGRKLKNPEHRKLGYGPSCYKKMKISQLTKKSLLGVIYDSKARTTSII